MLPASGTIVGKYGRWCRFAPLVGFGVPERTLVREWAQRGRPESTIAIGSGSPIGPNPRIASPAPHPRPGRSGVGLIRPGCVIAHITETSPPASAAARGGDSDRKTWLRGALRLASDDPPPVMAGNLLEETATLAARTRGDGAADIPLSRDAYLAPEERSRFVEIVSDLRAVWISFEGYGVLPEV